MVAETSAPLVVNQDYAFTVPELDVLGAVSVLPGDLRAELLTAHGREHGADALADLFARFVGLANSVVANNREMVEFILIVDGNKYPQEAERANLPTILGALTGVRLAAKVDAAKACTGCAFRRGTPANQSVSTTYDAKYEAECGGRFMCHERGLDEHGEPTLTCIGFAQFTHAARMEDAAHG